MKSCLMFFVLFLNFSSVLVIAAPRCSKDHCKGYGQEVEDLCGFYQKKAGDDVVIAPPNGGLCLCACSCVTENTLVLMRDMSTKLAKDIREGDELYSPFTADHKVIVKRVIISPVNAHPIVQIHFGSNGNDFIEVTPNHLFMNSDLSVKEAEILKTGDTILGFEGKKYEILDATNLEYDGNLINFILSDESGGFASDHIYLTNHLYSGDLLLQISNDQNRIIEPIQNLKLNHFEIRK